MATLKYKIIKSKKQYNEYCDTLEQLVIGGKKSSGDEIELLTFLIEKWDEEHNTFDDLSPIDLLKALMDDHALKSKDLVKILGVTKGTVSKILNRQKGLSKDTIRILSAHFKVSQEAFNRPYKLANPVNKKFREASLMNTRKELADRKISARIVQKPKRSGIDKITLASGSKSKKSKSAS